MARKRMVTRTIITTEVNYLGVNIETQEVIKNTVTLNGSYSSEKLALKELKNELETDVIKIVSIVGLNSIEKLYGLSELEFISYAKELDQETRKEVK